MVWYGGTLVFATLDDAIHHFLFPSSLPGKPLRHRLLPLNSQCLCVVRLQARRSTRPAHRHSSLLGLCSAPLDGGRLCARPSTAQSHSIATGGRAQTEFRILGNGDPPYLDVSETNEKEHGRKPSSLLYSSGRH